MRAPSFTQFQHGRALRDQSIGVLLALYIVAAVTVSLLVASRWLPVEHVTIVYLIPVIVAALRWGAIPALVAGMSGPRRPGLFLLRADL